MSSSSPLSSSQPIVLSDFVNNVPSPLTFALVSLSDKIALLKSFLQILNWRSTTWFDGFLAVAAWWAFCRFVGPIIKYFLPGLVVAAVAYTRYKRVPTPRQPVVTETLLQTTISDLTTLPVLLPSLPSPDAFFSSLSVSTLVRSTAILYVPYVIVTSFVPLHLIFSVVGTVFITWRAPFAILIRRTLWKSAFVRWSVWTVWSHVSGRPLPPKTISPQTQQLASTTEKAAPSDEEKDSSTATTSLRFLFTVYENQRWWMGLDWTAALLPGERPSWCSASQAPLSPPGAFSLPEPTATYIPHPTDPTKKIKRTAEWYWEEPEWRVLVKKEGTSLSRVERPVPSESPEDEDGGSGSNKTSSRLLKAASSKFGGKENKDSNSIHRRDSSSSHQSQSSVQDVVEGADEDTDGYTDPDGWVYGDNKWENKSSKGGMSKYTRYRRWTRVAVLTEFTQIVDATPDSTPEKDRRAKVIPPPLPLDTTSSDSSVEPQQVTSAGSREKPTSIPTSPGPASRPNETPPGVDSPLRQRLRNALNKGSGA